MKQGMSAIIWWIPGGLTVAVLAVLPWLWNAYVITIAFTVLIAYILAQSWDWVAGEMGYVNLGHYCFYGIGAYVFSILLVGQWPLWVAFSGGIVVTAVAALLISVPLFRLHGDYFAFATLALLPLMEVLAFNLSSVTNGADGIVLPVDQVLKPAYLIALIVSVLAFLVTLRINAARFGYALKSIRNDEQVAETVGVRIAPVKRYVLVLSAAFGGLAGSIQTWQMSYIDPPTVFGLHVALAPVAMVLFAGSGLRWGPLIGVLLLATLQQWMLVSMRGFQATLYGLIVLIIGRFMPGGFLRARWIQRVPILERLTREQHEHMSDSKALHRETNDGGGARTELPIRPRTDQVGSPLIELQGVRMQFGGNVAVNDVSLSIKSGEIVGLIGPNGSGKTTLFNCISRVYVPTAGRVLFAGNDLGTCSRDQVARLGVGRTYQIPRPFGDLTVQENIAIPLMFSDSPLSPRDAMREAKLFIEYAELGHRLSDKAENLSVQEKKALEFARALACKPRLLLVDEVASGLTPAEVQRFVEHIRHVRDRYGITVIWVEHIFSALEKVVDRVIVLEQGSLIADGPLAQVVQDERVLSTYLGSSANACKTAATTSSVYAGEL